MSCDLSLLRKREGVDWISAGAEGAGESPCVTSMSSWRARASSAWPLDTRTLPPFPSVRRTLVVFFPKVPKFDFRLLFVSLLCFGSTLAAAGDSVGREKRSDSMTAGV